MHLPLRFFVFLIIGLIPALAISRSNDRVEAVRERHRQLIPPNQLRSLTVAALIDERSAPYSLAALIGGQCPPYP